MQKFCAALDKDRTQKEPPFEAIMPEYYSRARENGAGCVFVRTQKTRQRRIEMDQIAV